MAEFDYLAIKSIFSRMVEIIDRIEDLPKECPEILKSPTFQKMIADVEDLCKIFDEQTNALMSNVIFPPTTKGGKLN